jgi:IS30 family transposase
MAISGQARNQFARDEFWRLRVSGMVIEDITRQLGINVQTPRRWLRETGGVPPRPPAVPSGRYLSLEERESIAQWRAAGWTKAQMARELGRHPATVGRELDRNSDRLLLGRTLRDYRPSTAQRRAQERAKRPRPAKLRVEVNAELHDYVQAKLLLRWSPKQITRRLLLEFPDRPEMQVSHETIYQALYVQSRGALRRELAVCLRSGRAVRRPKRNPNGRRPRVAPGLLISERPAEAEDRAVPGHWEGDLILGTGNNSAIGTLVERSTRFCILLHLPDNHGAEQVNQALIAAINTLPQMLRGSLTWDQGVELSKHADVTLATDLQIYFCDPHSPWQRGSNENTNGLLRQYFPKGTDLRQHSAEHLTQVANELNDRPRETLGFRSPREALNELLVATAA